MKEIFRLLGGFSIADFYPSIKILQVLSRPSKKLEKLHRDGDMILQEIIDDHRSSHKKARKNDDLVDVLLKIQNENDRSRHPLTDDNIKSVIQVRQQIRLYVNTFIELYRRNSLWFDIRQDYR